MIELRRETAAEAICLLVALAVMPVEAHAATARAARHATAGDPVRMLDSGQVVLAPALRRAIRRRFPGFHLVEGRGDVGGYCAGDFDGNGLADEAVYLSNRRRGLLLSQSTWLFVAFHQTHSGTFQPYLIAQRPDPSTQRDRYEPRPQGFDDYTLEQRYASEPFSYVAGIHLIRRMVLPTDAIVESGEDGERVWYFRGGRYHEVQEPSHAVAWLSSGRFVLAPALRRAIIQHFPGFHQIGSSPAAADFDGNGLEDAALYLSNRRRGLPLRRSTWLFVAFHHMPSGEYLPHVIARRPDPSTKRSKDTGKPRRFSGYDYILTDLGGGSGFPIVAGKHRERQMILPHDAIIERSDEGDEVWFFRGGQYHGVWAVGGLTDD
jgi:hypothetical protein